MIFADKLIQLRKKNGWSQEELGELMNVSRQAVSKWEAAQSIPDLERIIKLSHLFGVSTDYLLKDSLEEYDGNEHSLEENPIRKVSVEEANTFLTIKEETSKQIALATYLSILSPIGLFLLLGANQEKQWNISENLAVGLGLMLMLALVVVAVILFISSGFKSSKFNFLESEIVELTYGVEGIVKAKQEAFRPTYQKLNIIGTVLCIVAIFPLFIGIMMDDGNSFLILSMLSLLLLILGIGVMVFIRAGIIWTSYEKLLQVGDYSIENKKSSINEETLAIIYWPFVTAIYIGYSFLTNDWTTSWIVWVVAGLLYPVIVQVLRSFKNRSAKHS